MVIADDRFSFGNRSEIMDAEGAVPAASPMQTPNRESVSEIALRATPASAVMPLQITNPPVMIERRLLRSAQRATGAARIEYIITKPKPVIRRIDVSDKWDSCLMGSMRMLITVRSRKLRE